MPGEYVYQVAKALDLRTLQAVAGLGLLAHDVQHRVNQLCALCVVALGPIVARAGLQFTQHHLGCRDWALL